MAGEVLGLVGESGSGKSVTALAVMGLLPPTIRVTAGKIRLLGNELTAADAAARAAAGSASKILRPWSNLPTKATSIPRWCRTAWRLEQITRREDSGDAPGWTRGRSQVEVDAMPTPPSSCDRGYGRPTTQGLGSTVTHGQR